MEVYLGKCRPEGDFRIRQKKFKLIGTLYGTIEFESGKSIILNQKDNILEIVATIARENPGAPHQPSRVPPFMQGDHVWLAYNLETHEVVMQRAADDTRDWCAQPVFW